MMIRLYRSSSPATTSTSTRRSCCYLFLVFLLLLANVVTGFTTTLLGNHHHLSPSCRTTYERQRTTISSSPLLLQATATSSQLEQPKQEQIIQEKLQELLNAANEIGQVGSLASEEDQSHMIDLANELTELSLLSSSNNNDNDNEELLLAHYPLIGEHTLLYSAAPGGSSGRLFGTVVGKVTQYFETDTIFYNRVSIGPLQISLQAKREIKNQEIIKVTFLQTTVSLFNIELVTKELKGGGNWKVKYVGIINDNDKDVKDNPTNQSSRSNGGGRRLIRVMETPSLFILEQKL